MARKPVFKKCPRCKLEKESSAFQRSSQNVDGLSTYCKLCRSEQKKKQYKCRLAGKYGITIQDYNKMLIEQNGRCAICSSEDPKGRGSNFHIDHNHATHKVRALLCANCNTGIGLFLEDVGIMRRAISYLEKHQQLGLAVINLKGQQ